MLRRVGSARAWKGSSCVSMYIHYNAHNVREGVPVFFRYHHCGLRDTPRHSLQQENLPSSSHFQCPASQPRMPARKSSNGVLSPRRWNTCWAAGRSPTIGHATSASASTAIAERRPHERSPDGAGRHVQRPLRPPARAVRRQARVGRRPRRLTRLQHRWRDGGRPVGRLGRRGPHRTVDREHDHQRVLHHQEHDLARRARAGRPRRTRPRRERRRLLARVRGPGQGGDQGSPAAVAHLGRLGLGPANHPRGPVRLGQIDRPAGRPGALVGTRDGLGLPRAELRPPDRRSDPAHHRPAPG